MKVKLEKRKDRVGNEETKSLTLVIEPKKDTWGNRMLLEKIARLFSDGKFETAVISKNTVKVTKFL